MGMIDLAAARADDTKSRRRLVKTCEASERLNDAAHAAKQLGKTAVAVNLQRRAAAISPESWPIWNHLAVVLWDAGEYEEAQQAINRAFALAPDETDIHTNAGIVAASLGRYVEAERHLAIARSRKFDDLNVAWSYAFALLDGGDWPRGLQAYECRLARSPNAYKPLPYPLWDGSDLNGKTIFVSGEQGIGDRILFSRYLHWLKQKYPDCRVIFLPSQGNMPDLVNLFWEFRDIEMVPPAVHWPQADCGIFLISLARFHGTTPKNVPPDPGFIRKCAEFAVEETKLPEPLSPRALKIGVAWTGNPSMALNYQRTLPLAELMKLMENPRYQLYSLQGPPGRDELKAADPNGDLIFDCWPAIAPIGLTATAGIMLNCDLIITGCTATAHLAGALGVPCWTLLANDPYWIWGREGSSTPWYPQMRLYRQARPNDWNDVFEQVRRDLAGLALAGLELPREQRARVLAASPDDLAAFDAPWAQQNPREMVALLELIRGAHSVLEIGSAMGQTLKHFAGVLAPGAVIRSIDLGQFGHDAERFAGKVTRQYLERTIVELSARGFDAAVYFGDSHCAEAMAWAANFAPYDLVLIDGDHSYQGVKQDFEAFGPLGRLVAFHDIAGTGQVAGVNAFWTQLKSTGAEVALEIIASEMGIGVVRNPPKTATTVAA